MVDEESLNSRMAQVVDFEKSKNSRMCVYIAMLDYKSDNAYVLEWPGGGLGESQL